MIATPAALLPAAAAVISALPAQGPTTPRPAPPAAPPGSERGEEFGKTSPIALVVVLLLLLATILLIRSMNSRLRNVPASFDDDADAAGDVAGPMPGSGDPGGPGALGDPDGPAGGGPGRARSGGRRDGDAGRD